MANDPARSGCSSVSTFAKQTSLCFSLAASNVGAKRLHGPHHSAQKSTITIPFFSTSSLKLSLVACTVPMASILPRAFTRHTCDASDSTAFRDPRQHGLVCNDVQTFDARDLQWV